ncbi:RNA-directed DNA polymerase [Candidatus Saccharibacteria bacterium]|nr:RNA-directed DNA polymerase [Candidatus Saccharibacteria bacterium]
MKLLEAKNPGSELGEPYVSNLERAIREIDSRGFHTWLVNALTEAYMTARKGKRATYDMHEFELHWEENILNLAQSIEERVYEPGSSIAFVIFDPKVREIFAAPARDRSVHHLVHSLGDDWWDKQFIFTSTSCRKGKGTLMAIKKAQQQMLEVTENCARKARVVKLDLQGYFMSLPREKLYRKIAKDLDRQFEAYRDLKAARLLYALCKFLWGQVIMDDPVKKARKRGPKSNWDTKVLPRNKSLYGQMPGYGIVIGNLTSQLASNIYLDKLDKFVTVILGYKYYGRYVDDFYIMVREEEYAKLKRDIKVIEDFISRELELTMHPKKRYMQSIYKGLPYLGARIYPRCLYPSDRTQAKFKKAVREYSDGVGSVESVISYLGHMKHLDADGFICKVFREYNWDFEVYLESKADLRRPMADLVEEMARKI